MDAEKARLQTQEERMATMTQETQETTQVARRMRALGSSVRLRILQVIEAAPSPLSIGAMAEQMNVSPSAVSQQMKILYAEGFVEVQEPSGDPFVHRYYHVNR